MNILIIGAPGSGKGTMSEMIVEKYGIVHISTGEILRAAIREGSQLGLEAKKYIEDGHLVPDKIVNDIILDRLLQKDVEKGFLLDGYPRNIQQVKSFEEILNKVNKKIDFVLNLEIAETLLAKRVTGRRVCPNCKMIYHIENMKPKVEGICDNCQSQLVQRKDDTIESLKIRLDTYHVQTEPIIEYYSSKNLIKNIDAGGNKNDTFNAIDKILRSYKND